MNARSCCVWLGSILALGAISLCRATAEEPPPQVSVARPVVREVTDYEDFTGRTEAAMTVELRARVTGYLDKVLFKDGTEVKKGDLLFEIDPRPYQAELDRANAVVAQAEAHLKLTEAALKRLEVLVSKGVVSKEEFDKAVGERTEAQAAVKTASASRDLARLNVDFTRVTAPISGRIGRRTLDPGNLVKADETVLATIVSTDPVYGYFDVDERSMPLLRKMLREDRGDAKNAWPVQMALARETGFPHRGTINFVDNRVNPNTGSLQMRAVFANADGTIKAGMFVRVRVPIGEPHKALLVPDSAVLDDQNQKFLFVVDDKNVVQRRRISVRALHDGLREVTEGLHESDRVAIAGLQRLRPGLTVAPVLTPVPTPDPAPRR
jgi:RND family efflux transporter MFP subunit